MAGVDEVGRGALCGPVMACAVILGEHFDPQGVDDSKRLTPKRRELLAERIRAQAYAYAVGGATPEEIDQYNILRATHLAMRRAIDGLAHPPDFLLVDGLPLPGVSLAQRAIVGGDALSVSIAAASIVAKVTRDALMRKLDQEFPGYDLARNKGYGSASHRDALQRLGPTAIHRRTFAGAEPHLFRA
ncbi:MAG: ribonuclease HII [Vicinamibacteria bacterium]|nr:ribonuclease HII [Vicinamibacteria bacterium]